MKFSLATSLGSYRRDVPLSSCSTIQTASSVPWTTPSTAIPDQPTNQCRHWLNEESLRVHRVRRTISADGNRCAP